MSGLYVHIPFCRRKCFYCDFYSVGDKNADWPRFVDALIREAGARAQEILSDDDHSPFTLYIGGGTPSLIPESEFMRLSSSLLRLFSVPVEFTLEVNPDDVSLSKVKAWKEAGVNRISMGVQSMVNAELSAVGRRHDAEDVLRAVSIIKECFSNVSLDLIFGLPGQTLDSLGYSLDKIIELNPEHISVYSLMYEERTALTRMRDAGKLEEISDDDSVAMFSLINQKLRCAEYERYEISNYSRPGFRSLHNSSYWSGVPYLGLGPGAHSFDGKSVRKANFPDVRKYMRCIDEGRDHFNSEVLTVEELMEEMIMTRLRTIEGLDLNLYRCRFGHNEECALRRRSVPWIKKGSLSISSDNFLALTDSGIMISDEIIADLF